jgi:hypothetical protein
MKKVVAAKQKEYFARGEKYAKEYLHEQRALIRLQRQARKVGNFYVPPQEKLAFVIRIRG